MCILDEMTSENTSNLLFLKSIEVDIYLIFFQIVRLQIYLVFLRRKGGICGGGIPPEEKARRKKGGKLALFWEN